MEELRAGGVTDYSMDQLQKDIVAGVLLLYSFTLEIPALASTDLAILDEYCKSNNSSLAKVYERFWTLGERYALVEFIESY